jgi:hypothetical protein
MGLWAIDTNKKELTMPFTIHPEQKPSDDESYWRRFYDAEDDEPAENEKSPSKGA